MWRDHKLVMLLCTSVSLKQALWPVISKRPLELDDEGSSNGLLTLETSSIFGGQF